MTAQGVTLSFGKYRFTPLDEIPIDYLRWAIRECKLSSGLRAAVANELTRRGIETPPAQLPHIPNCPRCGNTIRDFVWQQDATGGRRIRVECPACRRFILWAPLLPEFIAEADRHAEFYEPAGPRLYRGENA
jgi:hypothetical protein